jgi:uncharacterized protein (TIGR02996 family)
MAIDAREQLAVFLRDVKDTPDDDTPRLVLADWLQDQGDPRGELIALSLQRSRIPEDDPRHNELWVRERRLLREHAFEWLGGLIDAVSNWTFRKGLLHIEARAERLLTEGVESLAEGGAFAWVESLRLTEVSARSVRQLGRSPILHSVCCLDLSENLLGDRELLLLVQSDRLLALRQLALRRNHFGEWGALALARCPHLANVRRLDVRENWLTLQAIGSLQERFGEGVLFA